MSWRNKTRGGYPVRILATDIRGNEPIAGAVFDHEDDFEFIATWDRDGRYICEDVDHRYDLVKEPVFQYLPVYRGNDGSLVPGTQFFDTAQQASAPGVYKVVKVEIK